MADFKAKTMKRKNVKGLALSAPPPKPVPSAGDAQIPGSIGGRDDKADTLEIGVEFRLDLRAEDLIVIKELGAGNGGTVSKVQHSATKVIMARKVSQAPSEHSFRDFYSGVAADGYGLDYTCRGKEGSTETDRERAADYARMQLPLYCFFLRRFHE